MAKQVKFSQEARQKLLAGATVLRNAVGTTLGPKGRNVAIDKKWGSPAVIHDGVTVAKEIELPDPFENMGAQLIKEAASKTNDDTGDGTTTATVLAHSIISEGLKNITAGANPMILRNGLNKGMEAVIAEIKKMSKPVKGKDEIAQVATISAADATIGNLIAEALNQVGKDGVVTVEEGKGFEMEKEHKEGMEFDKGYASPYFVSNADKMEAEIDSPYILITDKKITSIQELLPFLENFVKVSKNLVIIADDIEGEALATLVVNKLRGTFSALAIKAPGFGDRRKAMLEDIAILTGGTVISEDLGRKFDNVTIEDCGRADKVWADKETTRIIGGKGDKKAIQARVAQIRREIDDTTSEFDKEKLQERLAKLSGGVIVLHVGAATEVEMKEKKERVTDAVSATKAAIEEGIVPGGGIALFRARAALEAVKKTLKYDDEKTGVDILFRALAEPLRAIVANAGEDPSLIMYNIMEKGGNDASYGFDVITNTYGSMLKAGIVDPVKVTRSALQNAVSIGSMVLTTECMITDIPEKKEPPMPGGAGGMGGMGGMDMGY